MSKKEKQASHLAVICCLSDEQIKAFAGIFKALSDKTRQKIVLLLEDGEKTVTELVTAFDLSQPTISRHLSVLKQAGLVDGRREGQQVYYFLKPNTLIDCCGGFFASFECCTDVFPQLVMTKKR